MRGPPWARGGPSGPVGQPPRAAARAQGPGGGILAKRCRKPRSPAMVYMHPALEPAISVQTAMRLPEHLHQRFVALSRKTGRTAAFYMREALQRHIADLEDAFRADELIERIERGEEMWRGMDA